MQNSSYNKVQPGVKFWIQFNSSWEIDYKIILHIYKRLAASLAACVVFCVYILLQIPPSSRALRHMLIKSTQTDISQCFSRPYAVWSPKEMSDYKPYSIEENTASLKMLPHP